MQLCSTSKQLQANLDGVNKSIALPAQHNAEANGALHQLLHQLLVLLLATISYKALL